MLIGFRLLVEMSLQKMNSMLIQPDWLWLRRSILTKPEFNTDWLIYEQIAALRSFTGAPESY